jgi:hypothetical protein
VALGFVCLMSLLEVQGVVYLSIHVLQVDVEWRDWCELYEDVDCGVCNMCVFVATRHGNILQPC